MGFRDDVRAQMKRNADTNDESMVRFYGALCGELSEKDRAELGLTMRNTPTGPEATIVYENWHLFVTGQWQYGDEADDRAGWLLTGWLGVTRPPYKGATRPNKIALGKLRSWLVKTCARIEKEEDYTER